MTGDFYFYILASAMQYGGKMYKVWDERCRMVWRKLWCIVGEREWSCSNNKWYEKLEVSLRSSKAQVECFIKLKPKGTVELSWQIIVTLTVGYLVIIYRFAKLWPWKPEGRFNGIRLTKHQMKDRFSIKCRVEHFSR